MVLNYSKPGNFYWVPFSQWDQAKSLFDQYRDALVEIDTTPIAHRELGKGDVVVDRAARVEGPLVWREEAGNTVAFLNGTPRPKNAEVFRQVQQSFADNSTRFFVEHGISRLIVLRNDRGVHARDILEEGQSSGSQTSRMLLRSISSQGTPIPSQVQ